SAGLAIQGAPAREGAVIYTKPANGSTNPADAKRVGVVTSGTFSPWFVWPLRRAHVRVRAHRAPFTHVALSSRPAHPVPCSLKAPVAMGYVETGMADLGSQLAVDVRGKLIPATVTKMPFVPQNYYKPAK
ncbi:hypothetical protein EON67_09030, partial [archaeon]